jgi:hypothetical protein
MIDQEFADHTPEAEDAITAELVRCTLGQADRPELVAVTLMDQFRAMAGGIKAALGPAFAALAAATRGDR